MAARRFRRRVGLFVAICLIKNRVGSTSRRLDKEPRGQSSSTDHAPELIEPVTALDAAARHTLSDRSYGMGMW